MDSSEESAFFSAWCDAAADLAPYDMAVAGGRLAQGFAGIFMGGYQAAVRAIFADGPFDGWVCFAVSEDRSPQDPLPGVTWRRDGEHIVVDGYKTWVAGSRHVSSLVIKAGRGAEALYLSVPRPYEGLTLAHKDAPSVLPNLSQGIARFDGVRLDAARVMDASAVQHFGPAEVFFIYTAFLANVVASCDDARVAERAVELLGGASAAPPACELTRDGEFMIAYDRGVQSLRAELAELYAEDAAWMRDQALIKMYARRG